MNYWENMRPWALFALVLLVAGLSKSLVPTLLTALGAIGLQAWLRLGR